MKPHTIPMLRPGQLRERITLQRFALTAVSGDPVETEETWTDAGSTRAEIEPLTAGEATRSGQPVSTQPHRITYRTPALSIKAKDRITWHKSTGDVTLYVLSVADLDARGRVSIALAVLNEA